MVVFQLLDISSDDISESEDKNDKEFVITLYGKTNEDNGSGFNKNIVCHIHGFKPFFYIKIPETWKKSYIKNTFTGDDRGIDIKHFIAMDDIIMSDAKEYYEFYGYHQDKNNSELKFKFIKILPLNSYK